MSEQSEGEQINRIYKLHLKPHCTMGHCKMGNRNVKQILKQLKNVMNCQQFSNLVFLIKKILFDIKNDKDEKHNIILFSPAAASFDGFKNFEDRGEYFNNLVKKLINA